MLKIKPIPFRARRPGDLRASEPVAPPTLVRAEYSDGESIQLWFDQPIDISAINPEVFVVDDQHLTDGMWGGVGSAELFAPNAVRIGLELLTAATEPGIHLTVPGDNGIASTSGVAWSGVSELSLPFGE